MSAATAARLIPPLSEHVDLLLADIAIRVQLSRTNYNLAVSRYQAINDWLERDGSLLRGRVRLFYPQGSMAIGATIAARLTTDYFDIDLIAQLDLPATIAPQLALDLLYWSIRGERLLRHDRTLHALREGRLCRRHGAGRHAGSASVRPRSADQLHISPQTERPNRGGADDRREPLGFRRVVPLGGQFVGVDGHAGLDASLYDRFQGLPADVRPGSSRRHHARSCDAFHDVHPNSTTLRCRREEQVSWLGT